MLINAYVTFMPVQSGLAEVGDICINKQAALVDVTLSVSDGNGSVRVNNIKYFNTIERRQ